MKKQILALALLTGTMAFAQENYSTNWSGHKNVIVNTTAAGAAVFTNVTGFPVLVRLGIADSAIFKQAKGNGGDIRFTKSNNTTRIAHQIEKWDSAGRNAAVWVRVDTVYGNRNNQLFRLHWGNTAANDSSKGSAVFDTAAGFRAVWHMNDTGNVPDATIRGLTATANGSPGAVAGMVGGARSFNGTSYFEVTGSDTSLHNPAFGASTISAWVNPTAVTSDAAIVSKGDYAYALKNYRATNYEFFDFQDAWVASRSTTVPTVGTWVHLLAVNTALGPKLYVNGVLEDEAPYTESNGARNDALKLNIGREPQGTGGRRFFNGLIDEVRVHGVSRTLEWARLEDLTQSAGQTVVTLTDAVPALDTTAVPGAPLAVTATQTALGTVGVTWSAPASNGGSPITAYKAYVTSDETKSCTTTALTCAISGLAVGSYTFSVKATNAIGTTASAPSSSITTGISGFAKTAAAFSVSQRNGSLVFALPQGSQNGRLLISDMSGRQVWSMNISGANASWNGILANGKTMNNGTYMVRFISQDAKIWESKLAFVR